ncbi:MAG: hypothetical protein B6I36_10345 [Desulfobacteraceae bacterium 4572_35.1]|nr:MAG: hypothetical protein B6I36_10345 [Desulfobacteraceae bacterium 4572_35.1]
MVDISREMRVEITAEDKTKRAVASAKGGLAGLTSSLGLVGAAIGGLGLGMLAKDLAAAADSMTLMNAKLNLVSGSFEDVAAIAKETRQGLEPTVELYTRMARATEEMGLSQDRLLKITESLSKANIVSGASQAEAGAALLQLSQGMASGVLRGQELNSVMEQTPRIARMIAEGMGVTIGQLRQLGMAGEITTEKLVNALEKAGGAVDAEFAQMPATIAQSFTLLSNATTIAVGELDQMTGASNTAVGAITSLTNAVAELPRALMVSGLFAESFTQQLREWTLTIAESAGAIGIEELRAYTEENRQNLQAWFDQVYGPQARQVKTGAPTGAAPSAGGLGTSEQTAAEKEALRLHNAYVAKEEAALKEYDLLVQSLETELISKEEHDTQVVAIHDATQQALNAIDEQRAAEVQKHQDEITAIEDAAAAKRERRAKQEQAYRVQSISQAANLVGMIANTSALLADKNSRSDFERQKKFNTASAVVNTAAAAVKAYNTVGGGWWGVPVMLFTIAQGMAQVAAINSQTFDGGGSLSGSVSGGAPSVPDIPFPEPAEVTVAPPDLSRQGVVYNIEVHGNVVSQDEFARELIEPLEQARLDGVESEL